MSVFDPNQLYLVPPHAPKHVVQFVKNKPIRVPAPALPDQSHREIPLSGESAKADTRQQYEAMTTLAHEASSLAQEMLRDESRPCQMYFTALNGLLKRHNTLVQRLRNRGLLGNSSIMDGMKFGARNAANNLN